jgi:hypothetical protein
MPNISSEVMKMKKRILTLALALTLILSPTPAFAAVHFDDFERIDLIEIVPPGRYREIGRFGDIADGYAVVRGSYYGLIDLAGREVVPPIYSEISKIGDGVLLLRSGFAGGHQTFNVFIVDSELVVPQNYLAVRAFSDGLSRVSISGENGERFYGFIDFTGREVIPPQLDYRILGDFHEGFAYFQPQHPDRFTVSGFGFIDKAGREIVPPIYSDVRDFSDGMAKVRRDGLWGYIDTAGKEVIAPRFATEPGNFHDGRASFISPVRAESIYYVGYIDAPLVGNHPGVGYIDKTGNTVVPPIYYEASDFRDGQATVKIVLARFSNGSVMSTRSGVIDKSGNYIIPMGGSVTPDSPPSWHDKYDDVSSFSDGLARVMRRDRNGRAVYGFVDTGGNEVVQVQYDNAGHFQDGMAAVKVGSNAWEIIDKTGKVIIQTNIRVVSGNAPLNIINGMYRMESSIFDLIRMKRYIAPHSIRSVDTSEGIAYAFRLHEPCVYLIPGTPASWAREGVESAIDKGFVPLDLQRNYDSIITRAEFCRMAVKWVEYATGKDIDAVVAERGMPDRMGNTFSDTTNPYILAAFALGITSGTTAPTADRPGVFSPNGQFSREQAATMIMNTARAIGADVSNPPTSDFTDMNLAAGWAHNGINFVRANGIMSGVAANPPRFDPQATFTRQQSIVTFNNIDAETLPGR